MAENSCSKLISLPKSIAINSACSNSIVSLRPAITPSWINLPITALEFSPIFSAKALTVTTSGISILPFSLFSLAGWLFALLDFDFLFFFLRFLLDLFGLKSSLSSLSKFFFDLALFFILFDLPIFCFDPCMLSSSS